MARYRDIGPYAFNNVKIILVEDNHRERKLTPEGRARQAELTSLKLRGRPKSLETRAAFSAAAKRRAATPEGRAALVRAGKATKGRVVSENCKLALSAALRGRPKSDNHRQALSTASRLAWARKKSASLP